jgi:segregation and condensation protein A
VPQSPVGALPIHGQSATICCSCDCPVEDAVGAPEIQAVSSPAIANEAPPEPEAIDEPRAEEPSEALAPVEAAAEVESAPEPVEEISEPADQLIEADAKPESEVDAEPEAIAEPTAVEEPASTETPAEEPSVPHELAPETATASVESMEPALEDAPKWTTGQPAAAEDESVSNEAPAAEAELNIEQLAEQEPEPAISPKELMEPTPEQTSEPEEVSAATPIEDAASEPVSASVLPAPAAEELATEAVVEPASEIAETISPIEEPAEVQAEQSCVEPEAEAALEPMAEPASEPVAAAEPSAAPAPDEPGEPTLEPVAAQHPAKPFIKLETRDNEADLSPFSVVVSQVYDGPLDLLLDLIRKQDIDVYDIPIARITAQFLAYVNQLKATDVDVAGEFIYMASLLIHIKSKMLLPRAPTGPDEAPEDPRRELVERLLEHERFKNAAQMLQQKQMLEAASWTNPGIREFQDDAGAEPEIAADTVDLVRIFRDIIERARNRPVINLQEDSVTVGQMIQFLSRRLTMEDKPIALRRLLSHTKSERALIAMFLALLELVRLQAILLRQDLAFSEIFIKKHTGFESVMNDGLANAHDDWK